MNPTFRRSIVRSGLFAVVLAVLALLAFTPAAPAQFGEVFSWSGSQGFSTLLGLADLAPLADIKELSEHSPRETLVIVLGKTHVAKALKEIKAEVGGLKEFYDKGGALLIATDGQIDLPELHLHITGTTVHEAPAFSFRQSTGLPLVKEFLARYHPIFAGVSLLATDEPSQIWLDTQVPFPQALADFSVTNLAEAPPFGKRRCLMAGSGRDVQAYGRLLVIASPSVFLNIFLAAHTVDNAAFTQNCVDWLTNDGERKYCLFVEEGRILTRFDRPTTHNRLPSIEMFNVIMKVLEDDNFPNQVVLGLIPKHRMWQYLFVGVSLVLFIRLLIRGFKGRHVRETGLPLTERTLETTTPGKPVLEQRYDLLAAQGNVHEIARDVARHWLESHGLGEPGHPPLVKSAGGWWQRRVWQRRLDRLWRLAWGPVTQRINLQRFQLLLQEMMNADAALADQTLQLAGS